MKARNRKEYRERRHIRIRQKLCGSAERPRLSIMLSNKHIHLQFIDDEKGVTLAAVSTSGADVHDNVQVAGLLGKKAAEAALSKGIKEVVVDRGGFKYHGRVKAIVDSMRQAGVGAGVVREEK